jgi:hypothetical protein
MASNLWLNYRFGDSMNALKYLSFIILLEVLSGCDKTDPALLVKQPLTISVFKAGRPVSERHVLTPSKDHELLSSWLAHNQSGWHSSFVTYAPGTLVTGTNFAMNIQHSEVIINAGGKQFVRNADDSDFQFLLHKP